MAFTAVGRLPLICGTKATNLWKAQGGPIDAKSRTRKECPKRALRTTQRDPRSPGHRTDLLEQDFTADYGPNERWASDITYISTRQGLLYLAVVMDLQLDDASSAGLWGWISRRPGNRCLNMAISLAFAEGAANPSWSDRGSHLRAMTFWRCA